MHSFCYLVQILRTAALTCSFCLQIRQVLRSSVQGNHFSTAPRPLLSCLVCSWGRGSRQYPLPSIQACSKRSRHQYRRYFHASLQSLRLLEARISDHNHASCSLQQQFLNRVKQTVTALLQTPHLSHEASTAKYAYLNIGDLAAGLSPTRASSNASIHSSSTLQQPNLLTCHPSATSCAQDNVPLVASAPALHDQLGSRQDSGVVPHSSDVNSMPSDVRKLIAQIAEMQVASNSAGNDSRLPAPQDAPTFTNIQNSASPASSGIPTHHLGFEGCVHLPSHGTEASSAHHLLRTPPTPPNSAHVTRSVDTLSLKLQLEQLRQLQQQQQEIQQQTEVLRCAALNAMSMLAVPHPASGSATAAAAEVPLNYVPVTPGTGAAGISPLAWGMLADQQRLQQLQQQLVQQVGCCCCVWVTRPLQCI